MNEDSLLRAADTKNLLASATMGGSCTHLDQSWDWLSAQLSHRSLGWSILPLFYSFSSWGVNPFMTVSADRQNRRRFLAKLRYQYSSFLEESLEGIAPTPLSLHKNTTVTVNPYRQKSQREHTEQALLTNTAILQVYGSAAGELLILGKPGAGKTTLLYWLAQGLLNRAEADVSQILPVIFNLSSWAVERKPIADWLIEELFTKYEIPRHVGLSWVGTDRILPLLDGLDEVSQEVRAACVDSIHTYRQDHLVPLVVCSRTTEYLDQPELLRLHYAVEVQPLTKAQVDEYLSKAGKSLAAIRSVLRKNPVFQELVTTPLMLSIIIQAYRGKSVKDLPLMGSAEEQQRYVFAGYVERMFEHRGTSFTFTPQRIKHWLIWLASQMTRHSQSVFYLEQLQSDWLPKGRLQRVYDYLAVEFPAILVGMLLCIVVGSLLFQNADISLTEMLIGGLLGRPSFQRDMVRQFSVRKGEVWKNKWNHFIWSPLRSGTLVGILIGLSFMLSSVAFVGLSRGLGNLPSNIPVDTYTFTMGVWLRDGLIWGGVFGLSSFLLSVILQGWHQHDKSQMGSKSRGSTWRGFIDSGLFRDRS